MTTAVAISPLGRQFTTAEAAAYLGISIGHLRALLRNRKIRALRDGRVRIYQQWCDEYVARHTTPVDDTADVVTEPAARVDHVVGIRDLMPARRRFAKTHRSERRQLLRASRG